MNWTVSHNSSDVPRAFSLLGKASHDILITPVKVWLQLNISYLQKTIACFYLNWSHKALLVEVVFRQKELKSSVIRGWILGVQASW